MFISFVLHYANKYITSLHKSAVNILIWEGVALVALPHTVSILFKQEPYTVELDPTVTFTALVNGLVSECPEQAVSIHVVGHSRVLDLFVIEKELPLLLGDDNDVDGNRVLLRQRTFRKVFWLIK